MRLYIAGPMTGLPDLNYPAFNTAAEQLRAAGYQVTNPAENVLPMANPGWADYMAVSLEQVKAADGLALLPGWTDSKGAWAEVGTADARIIPAEPIKFWLGLARLADHLKEIPHA